MIEEGQIFAERYEIRRMLGSGGYSRVYLAQQTDLRRYVALKILKPDQREQPQVRNERFEREARVVARLSDPHTVVVHDFGQDTSGHLFIAFEYVDGVPLGELIKREGRFHERRMLNILEQVLRSLTEAHGLGLIHRDIKPANVIVQHHPLRGEWVKVVDFGIARQLPGVDSSLSGTLTGEGNVIGTPAFMAPEQATGAPVSAATDVYACGLLALTMLTGTDPPNDDWALHRRVRHDFEVPDSLPIRPQVRSVLEEMLRTEVTERLADARDALAAITALSTDATPEEAGFFPAAVDTRGMTNTSNITGVTDQVEAVTMDMTPPVDPPSVSPDRLEPEARAADSEQELIETWSSPTWVPLAAIAVVLLFIIMMLAWGALAGADAQGDAVELDAAHESSQPRVVDEHSPDRPKPATQRPDSGDDRENDRRAPDGGNETSSASQDSSSAELDETEQSGSEQTVKAKSRQKTKRPKRVRRPRPKRPTKVAPSKEKESGFEPIDDVLRRGETP